MTLVFGRPPGRRGPRESLRSKILWGEGGARERADGVFCKKQKAPEQSELCSGRPLGGRAPGEICASKVSRGEGGMTERYEKSPVKRPGFLNGAKSMDRPPGRQGPRKNLRSKILWGSDCARRRVSRPTAAQAAALRPRWSSRMSAR